MFVVCSVTLSFASPNSVSHPWVLLECVLVCLIAFDTWILPWKLKGCVFFNQDFDGEVLTAMCINHPHGWSRLQVVVLGQTWTFLFWAMFLVGQPNLFVLWMLELSCRQPLPSWDLSIHGKVSRCLLAVNWRQLPWKGMCCPSLISAMQPFEPSTPPSCPVPCSCDWVHFHTAYAGGQLSLPLPSWHSPAPGGALWCPALQQGKSWNLHLSFLCWKCTVFP